MKPGAKYLEEQRTRTLYVRLPHTIRDVNEVKNLFEGDFKVKQPRQSSRHCQVIFNNVEEKKKALKSSRGKMINGKRVFVTNPKPVLHKKKLKQKKIVVPIPAAPLKITRSLFVSNIKDGTRLHEIMNAFPGCKMATLVGPNNKNRWSAFVKMESLEMAAQLLKKECEWPIVRGKQLFVRADSRKSRKRRRPFLGSKLKIWDGENEISPEFNQTTNQKQLDESEESDEDEADEPQTVTEQE